jgi:hypothetical protein
MLNISIYSQAVFLFQVAYYIYQGNSKWQHRRKMRTKIENEHPKRLLSCLIIMITLLFIYKLLYASNLIIKI